MTKCLCKFHSLLKLFHYQNRSTKPKKPFFFLFSRIKPIKKQRSREIEFQKKKKKKTNSQQPQEQRKNVSVHGILDSHYKKRRQINVYLKDWSVIRNECEKKWNNKKKKTTKIIVKKNTILCVCVCARAVLFLSSSSSSSSFFSINKQKHFLCYSLRSHR